MKYSLLYGKGKLAFDLDDSIHADIISTKNVPGIYHPEAELMKALENPISTVPLSSLIANPHMTVGIVFSDITRASPSKIMLPVILNQLKAIPRENIRLFNALGTHRANTEDELRKMLGEEIVENFRIIQNNSDDMETQIYLGDDSFHHEIWINQEFYDCDLKILTGFIEPHFFAGFSGGGKAIIPGMAGWKTIFANHSRDMITQPNATWGITDGNPFYEEVNEIIQRCGKIFLVNVTTNNQHEITGIFCGDPVSAHDAGCRFMKETSMFQVPEAYDIVITSNSGYPLDLNLYQSVKGMSAAAKIVKPGGSIIMAAECSEGFPDHGYFKQRLFQEKKVEDLFEWINSPHPTEQDEWQVIILSEVLRKAKVFFYSDGLDDEKMRQAFLTPIHSISDAVKNIHPHEKICILPEGPLTIPYL